MKYSGIIIPSYDGEVPTKDADDEYFYYFDGWSREEGKESGIKDYNLAGVSADLTFYAAFSKREKVYYTITWAFNGGDVIEDIAI